jgi:PIN domain nuclease of toxin-antitoxin system
MTSISCPAISPSGLASSPEAPARVDPVVSTVTIWEAAIKRGLDKLDAPRGPALSQLERAGVELLPVTPRHADHVASLPAHHRDPFDRLLVAQAAIEGLPLVSDDEMVRRYDIEVIW